MIKTSRSSFPHSGEEPCFLYFGAGKHPAEAILLLFHGNRSIEGTGYLAKLHVLSRLYAIEHVADKFCGGF